MLVPLLLAASLFGQTSAPSAVAGSTALSGVTPDAGMNNVYVGIYLSDVSNFELKDGHFRADLQVWQKWAGSPEAPPLTFENAEIDSKDEIIREHDGDWHSVRWRIQGTFRGTFPLHRFPFDRQSLQVELSLPKTAGVLVPDLASSGMAKQFSITGWIYEPYFQATNSRETIASDFGSIAREGRSVRLERLSFSVELTRPFAAYVLKFLLPLGIIFLMALLACFLPPDRIDVRSGIGVTALLSCVAFHFSQADTLPDVAYLVAADKLFLGAYVLVVLALIATVIVFRLAPHHPAAARWTDRVAVVLLPAVAAIAVASLLRGVTAQAEEEKLAETVVAPPSSTRPELVYAVAQLETAANNTLSSLQRRGLSHEGADGEPLPHLVDVLPALTNDRVRLLPSGGMRVRWQLKPGLRWNDGTPITSRDLAVSAQTRKHADRESVEVIDELTIDVYWKRRLPSFLLEFPVYPHTIEKVMADGGFVALNAYLKETQPVGDGPYRLVELKLGERARFERNPHFAGPKPPIERIVLIREKSPEARLKMLLAGTAHLASGFGPEDVASLSADAGLLVHSEVSDYISALWIDRDAKPFGDLRVRQALNLAVDREAMMKVSGGVVATSYRRNGSPEIPPELAPRTDPDESRALLLSAGLTFPVKFTLHAAEATPDSTAGKNRRILLESLKAAGFEPELKTWKAIPDLVTTGESGGVILYSRGKDALPFSRLFGRKAVIGGGFVGKYDDVYTHEVGDLSTLHAETPFAERREVLERRLERLFLERVPAVPIGFGALRTVHPKDLQGVKPEGTNPTLWNVERWYFGAPETTKADAGTPALH